jgi:hypothetical protein
MSNPTKDGLQLIASLPSGTKKPLKKRKPTKKESAPKPAIVISTAKNTEASETPQPQSSPEPVVVETHNVIFKPNAGPQTFFLAASEREVLYGGAAGGGKSYAMLADPLRYMGHPQFSGLLLRHTTEELR